MQAKLKAPLYVCVRRGKWRRTREINVEVGGKGGNEVVGGKKYSLSLEKSLRMGERRKKYSSTFKVLYDEEKIILFIIYNCVKFVHENILKSVILLFVVLVFVAYERFTFPLGNSMFLFI